MHHPVSMTNDNNDAYCHVGATELLLSSECLKTVKSAV